MFKNGLFDIETIYNMTDSIVLFQWLKFKDIIMEQRKRYYTETFCDEWEQLVTDFIIYREKIGDPWTPPETLSNYVPDQ